MPLSFSFKRNELEIFFICISYALYFLTNNILFGLIPLIVCSSEFFKALPYIIFFFIGGVYFLFIDFYTTKDFILLMVSIILLSSKFSGNILTVLKINSYVIFFMLIYFLTIDLKAGDWGDVLQFKRRLFLVLPNGKELNPNPLGLICAICAVGFIVNKKYLLSIFPLIMLILTQSRAAILLFFIIFLIGSGLSIRKVIVSLLFISPFAYFVSTTPLMDRFQEDGDGGRTFRYQVYDQVLNEHYLTGFSAREYTKMSIEYGTLDNMYLLLVLKYGVIFTSIIILFYLCLFLRNKVDAHYILRCSIFVACIFYGFFETGLAVNYMLWIMFAMSFNNVPKFGLKGG